MSTYHAAIMLKSQVITLNRDGNVRESLVQFYQSPLAELA